MSKTSDEHIIQSIRANDQSVVKLLYLAYRAAFVEWAVGKFKISNADALDAFQEAVIVFYQNVEESKIERLDSSIKTYLFGIGKYKLMRIAQNNKKLVAADALPELPVDMSRTMADYELDHQQSLLKKAFALLGENCRTLLSYFYYNGFDMETIANRMDYKNTDVVKSRKRACLVKLKDIFKTNFEKDLF